MCLLSPREHSQSHNVVPRARMLCLVKVLRNVKKHVGNELDSAGSDCVAFLHTNSCDSMILWQYQPCIYTFKFLLEVLHAGSKFHYHSSPCRYSGSS